MKVWLNERLMDAEEARVSVFDHGFLYGDGIYETVHAYSYKVFHWPDHYRRLQNSARRIALKCPWSSQVLEQRVIQVLKANKDPNASVRITVARGPGPLGLNPALCPKPTLVLMLHPQRDFERFWRHGVTIGIPKIRRNPPQALDPEIKSNNSLNTILAKMEAEGMGVFEAVLLNLKGYLTEGTTSNIFLVRGRTLVTPALDGGLLAGITRETVLKLAPRAGFKVSEGRCTVRQLLRADEAFLSSTTLEITPIIGVRIAGQARVHRIGRGRPGPITCKIHALFRASIARELSGGR